ncbi:MAG: FAD-dependent oxidoreductase [Defluviitaleaceae bacterium]|nr:FAD-dependent oxidoreductase [Defluviitaleaceae bacterium]
MKRNFLESSFAFASRVFATLLVALLLVSCMGDGNGTENTQVRLVVDDLVMIVQVEQFTPGTFTAVGTGGYGGDITLAVEFDAYSILSIDVVEHNESPGLADIAFNQLIPNIIEAQSTNIDVITGATYTSSAILDGVNGAIVQAGADPAALLPIGDGAPAAPPDVTQADLIVVGGGMGGLTTAISAAQHGASVIVIEKMAILGGSTMFGGGLSVAGSRWQAENLQGGGPTHDNLYEGWVNLQINDPRQVGFHDPSLIRNMVDRSGERFNWLLDLGHQVNTGGRMLTPQPPPGWPGGWTGPVLVELLENQAIEHGVIIHTLTRGTELITNADGAVTGVIATGPSGQVIYTANNAVVLATGGYSHNAELVQRFIPELVNYVPFSTAAPGHMGDGMIMAEAVGAVPYPNQWMIGLGLSNEFAGMIMGSAAPGILVNNDGERFVKEVRVPAFTGDPRLVQYTFTLDHYTYLYNYTIHYSPGGAFLVFDSSTPFTNRINQVENNLDHPDAFRGNTIAELANEMGVPAAALRREISQINAVAAGLAYDRLGRTANVVPIGQWPFYAIRFFPMDMGTIGGVVVNDYYQVLDAQGEIIPGLFAVGEMSNRRYIAPMYFSGLSLMLTLQQGIVAGEAAAN